MHKWVEARGLHHLLLSDLQVLRQVKQKHNPQIDALCNLVGHPLSTDTESLQPPSPLP